MKKSIQSQAVVAVAIMMASAVSFAAAPGEAIYKAKCAMCHGATGTPSAGMAKLQGVKAASDPAITSLTDGQMFTALKNGKGKMKPVTGLTDAEIREVVIYYRGLK